MVILESHVISLVFILFRKCICLHGRLLVIFGMACAVPFATDGDVTRLFLGLFDGKGFVFANAYCVIECASVFCVSSVYYGVGARRSSILNAKYILRLICLHHNFIHIPNELIFIYINTLVSFEYACILRKQRQNKCIL